MFVLLTLSLAIVKLTQPQLIELTWLIVFLPVAVQFIWTMFVIICVYWAKFK